MQALKEWARATLTFVTLERQDWDEWWQEFKRYNPVSALITEEFWTKYRKKLRHLSLGQAIPGCTETEIKLYQNYYAKRAYELRRDPEHASLFQNRPLQANGRHEDLTKEVTQ